MTARTHGRLRTLQRLDALGEIHEAAALCIHHPARSGKRGDGGAQPPVVCQRPGVALRIAAPQIQTRDVTRQRRLNWREVNKLRPCRLKQRQVPTCRRQQPAELASSLQWALGCM